MREHSYKLKLNWEGKSTPSYEGYDRNFEVSSLESTKTIRGSADPAFRGQKDRYNPEEMLLASLSSCHMLWFLHLATVRKWNVLSYSDTPEGVMVETSGGGGSFSLISLEPEIHFEHKPSEQEISDCHREAHSKCFIANSLKCDVNIVGVLPL